MAKLTQGTCFLVGFLQLECESYMFLKSSRVVMSFFSSIPLSDEDIAEFDLAMQSGAPKMLIPYRKPHSFK